MSRSSLRTVTNISIDGQAVNAYNRTPAVNISFKVNCDSLSWVRVKYYDNTDGTTQSYYYPKGGGMIAKHNGDTFVGSFGGTVEDPHPYFKLGHDYTGVFTIYQNYPKSGDADNAGPGKYDVLLGSGRIQEDVTTSTEVYIDKDIISIKAPVYFEDSQTHLERLVGGCMLQIDGVQTLIESYNASTGKATLASAVTVTAGKMYYLVSNYLECDPFYWYCRSDPEVAVTAEYDDAEGLAVSGVYSQAQDVAMQNYQFSCEGEQGNKSFTYDFDDTFPVPLSLASTLHSIGVICEIYTQENAYLKRAVEIPAPAALNTSTLRLNLSENQATRVIQATVVGAPSGSRVFLWRTQNGKNVLIGTKIGLGASLTMQDHTAEYGKTYTYTAILASTANDETIIYSASGEITPTSKITRLALLTENGTSYHRRHFTAGSTQLFDIGCQQSEITQTLGSDVYETESGQPGAVYTDRSYDTGSITVYADRLGSILNPITSGLASLDAIRTFIASKQPFIMQDNAGNCRIVALTSAQRIYDKTSMMTKLTFGWTEICKVENAVIS
ncbi:MAG: hypothetical protein IKH78_08090 [Ruminococcus sp.]|nr:hypothetical protein [Ruminococcus sp.]